MLKAVEQMREADLNAKGLNEWAQAFADQFSINVPILDESSIFPARRDIDIDLSRERGRADYGFRPQGIVKGTEITIAVPFAGDAEIFRVHASRHTMDYPLGRIDHGKIVFCRRGQNLDGTRVRQEFDTWLSRIKEHLEGMRQEVGNFSEGLKSEALAALQARQDKFKRDDHLLDSLGFPPPKKAV